MAMYSSQSWISPSPAGRGLGRGPSEELQELLHAFQEDVLRFHARPRKDRSYHWALNASLIILRTPSGFQESPAAALPLT